MVLTLDEEEFKRRLRHCIKKHPNMNSASDSWGRNKLFYVYTILFISLLFFSQNFPCCSFPLICFILVPSECLLLRAVRFRVLKRKPAGALVKLVIFADHGRVASKHDTVESEDGEDAAPAGSQQVAGASGKDVPAVAVETSGCVVEHGNDENGRGIW